MKRSRKFILCTVLVIMSLVLSIASSYATPATAENAAKIHDDAIVVDTHSDTLLNILDRSTWLPAVNIAEETDFQLDIPKMQQGGVDVQTFGAYTSGYAFSTGGQNFIRGNSRLLALINGLRWTLENNQDTMELALSLEDINRILNDGKVAAVSSIEGGYSLNETTGLELLRQYHDLGVRMLALTWSNSNALGEGVNEAYRDGTPSSGGLTELGREVIREMNRLGMVVDVSHMNEETFWGAIETSEAPVMASHSCVYNIKNHVRNLKDEQIKAIADGGGVIQVNFYNLFLGDDPENVSVKNLVDHIDYIANLVGVDHVGLGSDFDGADMPLDLQDASMVPNITEELLERGYSKSDIDKILGGNSLRLFKEVWRKAAENENSGIAPIIEPSMEKGEVINNAAPTLTAIVTTDKGSEIDEDSLRVIVDGNVYIPEFNKETGTISITVEEPLKEKFHVVTFEAANHGGKIAREARIFCIQQ
ncbi:MAG: dipeptidase [Caulobacteraceae bacterium]